MLLYRYITIRCTYPLHSKMNDFVYSTEKCTVITKTKPSVRGLIAGKVYHSEAWDAVASFDFSLPGVSINKTEYIVERPVSISVNCLLTEVIQEEYLGASNTEGSEPSEAWRACTLYTRILLSTGTRAGYLTGWPIYPSHHRLLSSLT